MAFGGARGAMAENKTEAGNVEALGLEIGAGWAQGWLE